MDKAEILALLNEVMPDMLKPTIDQLLGDVKTFMAESVSPLNDRLEALSTAPKADDKDQANEGEPKGNTSARLKLLEQKLAEAEAKEAKQAAEATESRFGTSMSTELDKLSPMYKSTVQEILTNRFRKDAVETDGQWITKSGKTLSESVTEFFTSDEGKHFLPSNHQNGVGATEDEAPKSGEKFDMNSAIMAAFL